MVGPSSCFQQEERRQAGEPKYDSAKTNTQHANEANGEHDSE